MTVKVQLPGQISVTRLGQILSLWKIHEGLYSFSKKIIAENGQLFNHLVTLDWTDIDKAEVSELLGQNIYFHAWLAKKLIDTLLETLSTSSTELFVNIELVPRWLCCFVAYCHLLYTVPYLKKSKPSTSKI